jgi:hypothetical protein
MLKEFEETANDLDITPNQAEKLWNVIENYKQKLLEISAKIDEDLWGKLIYLFELPLKESVPAEMPVINFLPDEERHNQIKTLEIEGWKLCVGCINYSGESIDCITCTIETRKTMGLPPDKRQKDL